MKEEIENFVLKKMLGFYVNRTAFLMSEGIAKKFSKMGSELTAQDFGILNFLYKNDGQTPSIIAKEMLRDKTTITRRVDVLVKKGFLYRQTDSVDGRVIRVYLTEKAQEVKPILIATIIAFHKELLNDVSQEELNTTIKTLEKVISTIMRS